MWPIVKRELPRAQLRLIGRGSEGYLTTLGPDITGLGWLEDPGDGIASWSAMIVPIKVGAGTRVKVAEGFSRNLAGCATTIGAFGYDVEDGREILLANRAEDFASDCIRLLRSPELEIYFQREPTVAFWSSGLGIHLRVRSARSVSNASPEAIGPNMIAM